MFTRKVVLISAGTKINRSKIDLVLYSLDLSADSSLKQEYVFKSYTILGRSGHFGFSISNFAFIGDKFYLMINDNIYEFSLNKDKVSFLRKLSFHDFNIPDKFRIGHYLFSFSKKLFIQVKDKKRGTSFLLEWTPSSPPAKSIIDRKVGASFDIRGKVYINNNRPNMFEAYFTHAERVDIPRNTNKEVDDGAFSDNFIDYSKKYGWLISGSMSIPAYRKQIIYCPPGSNQMKMVHQGREAKW